MVGIAQLSAYIPAEAKDRSIHEDLVVLIPLHDTTGVVGINQINWIDDRWRTFYDW